ASCRRSSASASAPLLLRLWRSLYRIILLMTGSACTAMSCDRNTSNSSAPLIWTRGSSKLSICDDDSFTKYTRKGEPIIKNGSDDKPVLENAEVLRRAI